MKALSIFPAYSGQPALRVNLNDYAKKLRPRAGKSPFLNAAVTDRFLRLLHKRSGAGYSFGGYLEDRRDLWRGSYLNDGNAVHLGIDVNLPAGTEMTVKYPSIVTHVIHDPDQQGGWGSVIIFRLAAPLDEISHFLYAHLARDKVFVKPGDQAKCGDIVAELGQSHENGGWYEHLHIQAISANAWPQLDGDLKKFDGYSPMPEGGAHPDFPDPEILL